ncbi:apolipoprotein B-100 isoform X2 [Megalops cyprinoides]|uniref:apolipoprotein B-100 isoform X2 n=1 Tax=Megalops cyprinoides TaxID=118141 RepID=UPI00186558F9|nr:apolipoprotein B-100 isoform X2 [Megalops cyprinoides]
MMGYSKLCLLLLLSTYALAQQGNDSSEEQSSTCPLAARFKNFKKYVYQYEAESQNGVSGTANVRNGPKVTCKVEVEVPQSCSFILRTVECTLSEVSVIDAEGLPVYRPATGAEAFREAMEKNTLKFTAEQGAQVTLFPEQDEPANILNIKRGIISALMVPVEDESNRYMATVHGLCQTDVVVNTRKDIATDVTVTRDLSKCNHFNPMADYTSPLALVSRMHLPLSQLISSTQSCNYQFDNKRKHMTEATCTEKHIFLPFSHQKEHGISSLVKQTLTLQESNKINNRYFDYDEANSRPLSMDYADDKAPVQTKDIVLATLRDLSGLAQTEQGQQRASLFQKLVTEIRGLKNETLSSALAEMMDVSRALTWQALVQCGTPECTSAILQDLRDFSEGAIEVDAVVYALGLMPKPCNRRVRDMLSMAENRQTKAVMYGLSNSVRKFYQSTEEVTRELEEVSEFMNSLLSGDCSGNEDQTFLTLRVIGNMGKAMYFASPTLRSTLLRCVMQPAASLSVQQAAIQAFRQMPIDEEISSILLQVFQDAESPVQKRVAAYLMLMKNVETADLPQVMNTLMTEQDEHVKSFVASHIANILNSKDPETQTTKLKITEALEGNEIPAAMDIATASRNYKMDSSIPLRDPLTTSVEGNMIFDSTGYMPREIMLETTLKAFGYNFDMFEVGMEGKGMEPSIDALFGENGFFPDSALKSMYWLGGKMPDRVHEVLKNWIGPLRNERMKRQVPENILGEIQSNFNKLVENLRSQDSPEALAYLRIMGTELGYIKTSEIENMAYTVAMYAEIFFKTLPKEFMKSLMSGTDNELFGHYIFMDNEFTLPTAAGFPLKFTLAGVFAAGAKGGLSITPGMKALSFMPSAGVEFVTQMGVHIPEFITAGIEMHTNMYHDSALNAKVTMDDNRFKLSIPAPQGTTQLFSISNRLLSVSTMQTKIVPPLVEDRTDSVECNPLFSGIKYCTTVRYSNASSIEAAPYYPLTGETRFALEIQPTGEVTEYTAALTYELLREGKEGRQKVDAVKLVLKAEGAEPSEATATLKYNRNRNTLTTDIQIPDCDLEAGIRLAVTDSNVKGKKMRAITIDVTNKNIPQLSLVGRARLEAMKDGMLQFQLTVPSLNTDATATATMKYANGLILELETSVNVPETSSVQKVILRYDENRVEVEMKSDMSSEIQKLLPETEVYQKKLQKIIDDLLDQKVAKTDMKLRHIVSKAIEAGNIWLDKVAGDIPYVDNLRNRRNIPELTLPSLPEKLYLKYDSLLRYQFNKNRITLTIPLLLGGKTSEDLNIPTKVSIPNVYIPEIGLDIPSRDFAVPTFTIPPNIEFTLPLMGMAEASAKVNSNFYNWEGSVSGGSDTTDVPSFIGKFKVAADCPINILSYEVEGTGMISGTHTDTLKYLVDGSLRHSLFDASFSIIETGHWADTMSTRSNYKIEASSPLGLQMSLYSSSKGSADSEQVTLESNLDGFLRVRTMHAGFNHTYTYIVSGTEARGDSDLKVDSTLLQAHNRINGLYSPGDLSIISNTNINNDALKHVAELSFRNRQLSLKCNAVSMVLGKALRNKVEFAVSGEAASIRVETEGEAAENRAYSVLSGSLNTEGLEINSEGSINAEIGYGSHKATLKINKDGLATSGTTTLQCSPLTFENIFDGSIDGSGATLSLTSKGSVLENSAELKVDGKIGGDEAYLNSAYKGNLLDMNTRDTMNMRVNRQGLTFSNNLVGSLKNMRTEHSHTLTFTLWTLAFHSKTDNFICDSTSYKHDIKVDLIPFVAKVSMNHDLRLLDVEFNTDGLLNLEPHKMGLKGSLRGAYGEEQELRHTYEINYYNLAGTVKCSTTGKILGAQMSHNSDLEVAGLSSKFSSEARFNSKSFRLDSTVRTLAVPFSLSVDAIVNSDGELNLYGKLTGQLYSRFLLKAQPLAVAYSHDCRASTTHQLESGDSAEVQFDNKINGVLSPHEQSTTWRMKSKLNNHAYNQDISVYNNPERIGVEVSGTLLTDILNKPTREARDVSGQNQEFSLSGFLKYDKNGDSHIIELPFIENFPAFFEKMKAAIVSALESLQHYINSADINQIVGEFRVTLDKLPRQVSDYMNDVDLENQFNKAKEKLIALTEEYTVTLDDLEISLENLKEALEKALNNLVTGVRDLIVFIKKQVNRGTWSKTITDLLTQIGNELKAFDERNEITKSIVRAISAIEDIIRQIDLQKLTDSSIAWLQDLDAKYEIRAKLQEKVSELKQVVESFDIMMLIQDLQDYISSINVAEYLNQLTTQIPTEEMARVIDSMKDVILNWFEEYEVAYKINVVYSKLRELLVKYEFDKKIEVIMNQVLDLLKQYKIQEAVQSVVNILKSIDFQSLSDKFMQMFDDVINHLKAINFKELMDELNDYIAKIVQKIQEFNYDTFVDEANQKISEMTRYVNEQIEANEIPQKIEASREFVRGIQASIVNYLEQLKNSKVAEVFKMMKDVFDTTAFNDIKTKLQENLEDMRQRVSDMDIREEILIYLHRASDSYTNMISYITVQINKMIEEIHKVVKDQEIINQIGQVVEGVLNALRTAEFEIPSFTVPLTDLVVPSIMVNLQKLHEINIPAQVSIPEFTILNLYSIPAITIDFEEVKQRVIELIDSIRDFELPLPEPESIFGDLRVIYLSDLPDLTFPEVTINEIKFPEINIPKLNLENFEITMLPLPELKVPHIPSEFTVPAFGKLYGEFRINSPHYNVMTTAVLQNATSSPRTPQFTASLTSQAKSTIEYLDYTLDASARLEAPEMRNLVFSETLKFTHMAFTVDHQGAVTLSGPSAQATAKTIAKATTDVYTADIVNNVLITLESGISASMETTYNHNLNIPSYDVSCQTSMIQKAITRLESGTVSVTVGTTGNGKWSIQDYSDDGTHKSDLEFSININTAKLTFAGETNSKTLKMKQAVNAESVIFSYITIDAHAETETPFIKRSVVVVNGKGEVEDLKIELTASHNTELIGRVSGSLSHSINFLARPFEVVLDCKNKANTKIIFPLKLTGKIDFQNDYALTLNSEVQHANWVGLARFNQYKYYHNFTLDNNVDVIAVYAAINSEANLDFLTVPLTIPEMDVPYTSMKTPTIKEVSLWEHTGLKDILTTTRQSFDMNFKLLYQKNPETHAIDLNLEPIYDAINENAKIMSANFELGRDKAFALLTKSYNEAKAQFEKFKIDTSNQPPRIFTVPGYTVPILNIEVSSFTAELPAFSFLIPKEVSTPSFRVPMMGFSVPTYTLVLPALELPVLHVPETLSELTLPTFTLPAMQNSITIPAMGNMTYDFSLKSSVITLNINAGLFNQSDIVARFGASSTSVFDILKGKLDATTSLTRKRGLKLATALSLDHVNLEGSHDSTVSLTRKSMEASVATTAKVKLPILNLEFNQELIGNTKTKPNLASKMKLKYSFNLPKIVVGKGNIDHNLGLEGLTSYMSLETSTKGKIDGTVMEKNIFAGALNNEANVYLNANGLRSTIKTDASSTVDHRKTNIWNMDMNKIMALEASLRRVYAMLNYTSNNEVNTASFDSKGKHIARATLDFVPLTALTANVEIDMSQPSSIGHAGIIENIDLAITTEKQTFSWSGKEQIMSAIHAADLLLSNDEDEARIEISESVEGYLAFLKTIKLPVYQKTIWDVLKFDLATSDDKPQFLNASTIVVYTKNKEGFNFALPTKVFENGITFSIPEITLAVPAWVKDIPLSIREIDMRFENVNFPDVVSLPPVIPIPAFEVPFTTLEVPSYTLDLKNIEIPNVISIPGFEIKLPGLPKMKIPDISVDTEYLKDKMSFLLMKIPQHEIAISSFTIPKSFTGGEHTIHLDVIASQISNFEMPAITIPEQKIEVPEISIYLPSGVFIPYFGALSTTVKFSSPIYNTTWTAKVENKDSTLVSSLKSSCSSTILLLEYDLDATATTRIEDGALSLLGKCTLSHSDLNVDWQHIFTQNLRTRRQASSDASSRHTLSVDLTSPTFIDMNFRYTSRKDGLSATVSSPSSGFLGFLLQRRTPAQFQGKLFARYPSAPEKDVEILSAKATLRNSEKLMLQAGWNADAPWDMLLGLKERVPAITNALFKFANKHHTAQFGMDLNRASLKLKNTLSNTIERAYHEIPRIFESLQSGIEQMRDQGKVMYKKATDGMLVDLQEVVSKFSDNARHLLRQYGKNIKVMLDAVIKFLSETKFQLPGSKDKLTGQELFQRASSSVAMAIDQVVQQIADFLESYPEALFDHIRKIEFTIPGTDQVVSGREILDSVKSTMRKIQNQIVEMVQNAKSVSLEEMLQKLSDFLQSCLRQAEKLIASLKSKDLDELSTRINEAYTDLRRSSTMREISVRIEEARQATAEYKDKAKMTIQDIYNKMTLERLNTNLQSLIEVINTHTNRFLSELIDFLQQVSKSAQPYVRVSNKKMDIEIPLPFFWKSFSEWPQSRY